MISITCLIPLPIYDKGIYMKQPYPCCLEYKFNQMDVLCSYIYYPIRLYVTSKLGKSHRKIVYHHPKWQISFANKCIHGFWLSYHLIRSIQYQIICHRQLVVIEYERYFIIPNNYSRNIYTIKRYSAFRYDFCYPLAKQSSL